MATTLLQIIILFIKRQNGIYLHKISRIYLLKCNLQV